MDRAFDAGLRAFTAGLRGLGEQVAQAALAGVGNIAQATARRAAERTPRSAGPGPHVADGWKARAVQGPGFDLQLEVVNVEPRATEPLPLKSGGSTTLLEILEYGSRPHEIEPKTAEVLVFFWGAVGRVVRAKKVRHPGTRPYSMLSLASVEAAIDMKRLLDALRTVLRFGASGQIDRLRGGRTFPARR